MHYDFNRYHQFGEQIARWRREGKTCMWIARELSKTVGKMFESSDVERYLDDSGGQTGQGRQGVVFGDVNKQLDRIENGVYWTLERVKKRGLRRQIEAFGSGVLVGGIAGALLALRYLV